MDTGLESCEVCFCDDVMKKELSAEVICFLCTRKMFMLMEQPLMGDGID